MKIDRSSSQQIILVTGAASSGKSEWAENIANYSDRTVIYIATSIVVADDLEWQKRIYKHQIRRPSHWETLEVPIDLVKTISSYESSHCLLIDSLGTWVANLLDLDRDNWESICKNLLTSLQTTKAEIILVGEETGWGIVPAYESARIFRDRLGSLIRQIGSIANPVYLVTGGHVLNLSILGKPLKDLNFD